MIAVTFLLLSALGDASGTLKLDLQRALRHQSPGDDGVLYARDVIPGTLSNRLKNQHLYSYGFNFSVGSDNQSITVNVDTGSNDLWFRGVTDGFNPYTSTTFKNLSTPWGIGYMDGTGASGYLAEDNMVVSGTPIHNVTFALAAKASMNGYLGLSYPTGDYPSFIQILEQNGVIQKQAFSLYLNGADTDYGQLLFGGVDHTKYNGILGVVPVVNSDGSNKKRCCFYIMWSGVNIRKGEHSCPFLDFNAPAVLDSGTSYTVLYPDILENLANAINYTFGAHPKYYTGNCDLSDTGIDSFELSFSGVKIQVPPETLLDTFTDSDNKDIYKNGKRQCQLAISRADSGNNIILGDMFLRNFYAVFDLENNEIGLANAIFDRTDVSDVEVITSRIPKATSAPMYSSTSFDKNIKSHTDYGSCIRSTASIIARSSSVLTGSTPSSSVLQSSESTAVPKASLSSQSAATQVLASNSSGSSTPLSATKEVQSKADGADFNSQSSGETTIVTLAPVVVAPSESIQWPYSNTSSFATSESGPVDTRPRGTVKRTQISANSAEYSSISTKDSDPINTPKSTLGSELSGTSMTAAEPNVEVSSAKGQQKTGTKTEVVETLITTCSGPTTFTANGVTSIATKSTVLTITDCSCTVTHKGTQSTIELTSRGGEVPTRSPLVDTDSGSDSIPPAHGVSKALPSGLPQGLTNNSTESNVKPGPTPQVSTEATANPSIPRVSNAAGLPKISLTLIITIIVSYFI